MDYILQKGTELGAYEFYPYKAVNSVIKENNKIDKKVVRWQRIVKGLVNNQREISFQMLISLLILMS